MKFLSFQKLKKSRFSQIWFTLKKVFYLSWQVNPQFLILALISSAFAGIFVYPALILEKQFIDVLLKSIGTDFWSQSAKTLVLIIFLRSLVSLVRDLAGRIRNFSGRMMSRLLSAHLSMLIARKNTQLDMSVLESPGFKDKFSKIERESSRRAWEMMMPFTSLPMYIIGIISTLILLTAFHPLFGLIIILVSIPEFLVDARFIKREYQFEQEASPKYRLWGWLEYYLVKPRNMLEIKLLGLAKLFSKKILVLQNEIFTQKIDLEKGKTFSNIIASLPSNLFLFFAGVYFAFLVVVKKITVGSAEMLLRAVNSFRDNITGLVGNLLEFYENYLYVNDLIWLLDLKPKMSLNQNGEKIPEKLEKGIELKNVWFRYSSSSQWVLKDINLQIKPDENIAIIGENGAGKTTLIKLLCRFYDPQKGKILLEGKDLRDYQTESLWQRLSVLFQEFEIYPFSARESIGYGDISKISKLSAIKKAAAKSGIDKFIESLPLGYENPLDRDFEKGVRPSWGQWQRIGLARVFLRRAPITILDEPTSNVDPKAEEKIFDQIMKLIGHRKILILISHHFSTVRQADRIYVMERGKFSESGSHQELMKLNGKYAKLFTGQAKYYQEEIREEKK